MDDSEIIVVDLDGTLLRSDLIAESFVKLLGVSPVAAATAMLGIWQGKSAFKQKLAVASVDVTLLPYNQDLLAWLQAARERGARLYLASASNEKYVAAVAAHIGVFDGWLGSDAEINLAGRNKADRIRELTGGQPYTYVGNGFADLPVWREAERCVAVECGSRCRRALLGISAQAQFMERQDSALRAWLKLLRVKQYAKNALVAVPLFVSHAISAQNIALTLLAAIAFSLCASAVYILNDLVDVEADRKHPTKRRRPIAAGTVPILAAPLVAGLLFLAAFAIAGLVGWMFAAVLVFYLALTTAYTLSLKRKMVIDAIVLAILYTTRVIAGAAAIQVAPSEWLLGFSLFIFSSLAFIKRYTELAMRAAEGGQQSLANRNYRVDDLTVVGALAAACGFNAVTFLALYISSDAVHKLYAHPQFLWLACPVMMYWIGRNLLLAHRGLMDDDPIVFALADRPSQLAAAVIAGAAILATF